MPPNDDLSVLDAPTTTVVHKPLPHDSARLHVQGSATYVDDIGEPAGTLHIAIGMANNACGKLKSLGLEAVRRAPGVVAVLTAADIPGKNDIAPVFADEPLFVDQDVMFHGQALFAVAARTRESVGSICKILRRSPGKSGAAFASATTPFSPATTPTPGSPRCRYETTFMRCPRVPSRGNRTSIA